MRLFSFFKLIGFIRLVFAQDSLLPPDFKEKAPLWLKALRKIFTFGARKFDQDSRGVELSKKLQSLGPTYIKLGQSLATRPDIVGLKLAKDLQYLQDSLPAFPMKVVEKLIIDELEQPVSELFDDFSEPVAAASIAQVHGATLHNGSEVVIKLVRPNIAKRINADMDNLDALAKFLCQNSAIARRLHLTQIMSDQRSVLNRELDMFSEGRNQIQLRRNFADSQLLYVPRLYSEHTRHDLLVMERVYGIPIGQVETLRAANVDFQVLAHKGVETFFTQVFEHNFFHADMHPGNIQVDITDPANPKYIALDCAIVGSLQRQDIDYLAQNILAFFNRDYRRVVDLHLRSGWIPATTDAEAFERVIAEVCDPIFNKPLCEISFADFMTQLLRTAAEFNMEIQPQLVLLQKTLLYIEGLGRQLYPQLDLWSTALPFMQRWATRNLGPIAIVTQILEQAPELANNLYRLPELLRQDTLPLRVELAKQNKALEDLQQRITRLRSNQRLGIGAIILITTTAVLVLT